MKSAEDKPENLEKPENIEVSESNEIDDSDEAEASSAEPELSKEDFLTRLKIQDLEKKVADYESKISSIRDYVKKMETETEEARVRARRDQQRLIDQKMGQFFQEFLQVMDNLDLSIKNSANETGSFVEGVRIVHQHVQDLLKRSGLEKIETLNQVFDPQFHEAISLVPVASEEADGKVVEELKSGYRFKENLIRPAQVLVGKKST